MDAMRMLAVVSLLLVHGQVVSGQADWQQSDLETSQRSSGRFGESLYLASLDQRKPTRNRIIVKNPDFLVPFEMASANSNVAEVQLYLSTDLGQNWKLYNTQAPTAEGFPFQAPADGEYWFAVRTINRGQENAAPTARPQAELKVIVDSRRPNLDVRINVDASGHAVAEWTAQDPNLDASSLHLSYQDENENWQEVPLAKPDKSDLRTQFQGKADWWLRTWDDDVQIRAEVLDRAGNSKLLNKVVAVPTGAGNTGRNTSIFDSGPAATRTSPVNKTWPEITSGFRKLFGGVNHTEDSFGAANAGSWKESEPRTEPLVNADRSLLDRPAVDRTGIERTANGSRQRAQDTSSSHRFDQPPTRSVSAPREDFQRSLADDRSRPPSQASNDFDQPFDNVRHEGASRDNSSVNRRELFPRENVTSTNESRWRDDDPQFGNRGSDRPNQRLEERQNEQRYDVHRDPSAGQFQADKVGNRSRSEYPPQVAKPRLSRAREPLGEGSRYGENSNRLSRSRSQFQNLGPNDYSHRPTPEYIDGPVAGRNPRTNQRQVTRQGFGASREDTMFHPHITSSPNFELVYEMQGVRGRPRDVELWITQDRGRTWERYGSDSDQQSPMAVQLRRQGLYGFQMLVDSGRGNPPTPPRDGDKPDVWVIVDWTKPTARISRADVRDGTYGSEVKIEWRAQDTLLADTPISLSYSDRPNGPWSTIVQSVPNTGVYQCRTDRRLPQSLYLRMEVRDMAGNVAWDVFDGGANAVGSIRVRDVRPVSRR